MKDDWSNSPARKEGNSLMNIYLTVRVISRRTNGNTGILAKTKVGILILPGIGQGQSLFLVKLLQSVRTRNIFKKDI